MVPGVGVGVGAIEALLASCARAQKGLHLIIDVRQKKKNRLVTGLVFCYGFAVLTREGHGLIQHLLPVLLWYY